MKKKKVIAVLTEQERLEFKKSRACKSACEKLVEEIIQHYELGEILKIELFDAVRKKYSIKNTIEFSVNHATGEVIETDESGPLTKGIIDRMRASQIIRDEVFEAFGMEQGS